MGAQMGGGVNGGCLEEWVAIAVRMGRWPWLVSSVVGASAHTPKGYGFDSRSRARTRVADLIPIPRLGCVQEATS